MLGELKTVRTPMLEVAYFEGGPASGRPVLLLHGFPYDVHAYAEVLPALAAAGCRVFVPYLRGHGPTRFLDSATPRSGQQAALGSDARAFLEAVGAGPAVVAGYDWGGRGACIVAALWPERVKGLVTVGGYNIQDIAGSVAPQPAEQEWRLWYQYYFHTPRGEAGLRRNRRELCRLLWRLWSPGWSFDEEVFARSAVAFDNQDWVDVVVQSYRHRFGYAAGDPALEAVEQALARQPSIGVPAVVLHGADDGVAPAGGSADLGRFSGPVRREVVAGAGHNLPQERPDAFVGAVLSVL